MEKHLRRQSDRETVLAGVGWKRHIYTVPPCKSADTYVSKAYIRLAITLTQLTAWLVWWLNIAATALRTGTDHFALSFAFGLPFRLPRISNSGR